MSRKLGEKSPSFFLCKIISMKAKQVLKLLQITRQTLSSYVKSGKLKTVLLPNGFYDYDDETVYSLANKNATRGQVIYCRAFSKETKKEIDKQKDFLLNYLKTKNIEIANVYSDIGSGMDFNRTDFQKLVSDVIDHKISKIHVVSKNVFSSNAFDFLQGLFKKFNCEICIPAEKYEENNVQDVLNDVSFVLKFCSSMC